MSDINELSKAITNAVKEAQSQGTSPYDTPAEVVRIEDGTAWVHIPGGVDETPAKMTVNCQPGDVVQVRVADGRAWITGNATAPPTDDKEAIEAKNIAIKATATANESHELAEEALSKIAGDSNQYFWHVEEGTDTGSHITEVPQDEFVANPQGANIIIRSIGLALRDALTELVQVASNLIRIGEPGKARTEISPTKFSIYSDNNDEAMRVTSVATQNVPIAEQFTVATGSTATTVTYTTPVLSHTINWGTLSVGTVVSFPLGDSPDVRLTFNSASDTPQATDTDFTVKGSIVGGNKVKLVYTFQSTESKNISAYVSYTYSTTGNTTVRIASDPPALTFYNSTGGATSYIKAYNGGQNGNNLVVQGTGNTFVGGGEYAYNRYAYNLGEDTGEDAYIGADGILYLESNANTMSNRYTAQLTKAGNFSLPGRLYLANKDNQGIYMRDITNTPIDVFRVVPSNNNLLIGYALRNVGTAGSTYLYGGQSINFSVGGNSITFNGTTIDGLDPSNVGTTYDKSASTSLASGTAKNITSQSFAVGTWLVTGTAEFPANATGRRAVQLSGTSGGDALSTQARSLVAPVNGGPTVAQFTFVLNVTATKTYYLVGYQNSGSALSTTGVINAVRIK